jgi:predicted ATP-grasp superfamily ATP-dependent carboligase
MNSEASEASKGAVVVPAIDTASSTVCLRSLGRRGIETIVVTENRDAPALRSKYCDRAIRVPSPEEDLLGYKDALVDLASRPGVRTIVPLQEADTYVLAKYREEFAEHVRTPWPSLEVLRNAQDRVRLFEAAERAGVPMPDTRLLDTIESWDRDRIVKARYALLANAYIEGVSERESRTEALTRHLDPGVEPDIGAMTAEMDHVPITQEFVPGSEYAVWALCERGEPIAICQRRRVRGFKYTGGASVCRQTMYDPELDSLGRALIDELDWHGPASIQFIKDDATGEYKLMEVNPRFWASVSCGVAAGLDFPYLYWRFAGGEPVRPEPTYERGVATHLLRGEAVYLLSVLQESSPYVERPSFAGELREVLASIYEQPRFDYLSLNDPRPFVRDLRNAAAELV